MALTRIIEEGVRSDQILNIFRRGTDEIWQCVYE